MDLPAFEAVDPVVFVVAVGVLVVTVVMALLLLGRRRSRKRAFQDRFGAEYDLTVRRSGSRHRAEADLERRSERRSAYQIQPLEAGERDRFRARWDDLQASFVDGPESAARGAEALVVEVAAARGYPEAVDRCLDDLSVDHPDLVAAVRRSRSGDGDRAKMSATERHRAAVLDARTLFERLVADGEAEAVAAPPPPALAEPSPHREELAPTLHAESHDDTREDGGEELLGPDGRPVAPA